MNKTRKRTRGTFLDNYRIDDTYMLKPNRAAGLPGMIGGTTLEGDPVIIKLWPRTGKDDTDLEEIWMHELRQLHRLAGYPGALDSIAQLRQTGVDEKGFYLVLDPAQRQPLQLSIDRTRSGHWLKVPRLEINRARMWRNLKRIAHGLETLHAQGLLHRNLDGWSVLTAGTESPDFQLTGFEWSMRLVASSDRPSRTKRPVSTEATLDSFLRDWSMFGTLAAQLLGAKIDRVRDSSFAPFEIADHLKVEEARLLRDLVQADPIMRLDGEVVEQRIDDVLRVLASTIANRDPKLYLVVRLGSGTPLAEKIRTKSDGEIETSDTAAQLTFVKNDIAENARLMALHRDSSGGFRIALRGHHLLYSLNEYRHPQPQAVPTWEMAFCDGAELQSPAQPTIFGDISVDASQIDVLTTSEARERFPRLRGKLTSWEEWRQRFLREERLLSKIDYVHRALELTQLLEALYATGEVYPIEIVESRQHIRQALSESDAVLCVRSRRDSERENLSKSLGLRSLGVRLHQALTNDKVKEEAWILTDNSSLGERNPSDTEWNLYDVYEEKGKSPIYTFVGSRAGPALGEAFLIPEGSVGRDVVFKRRLKALSALKHHWELLGMMADPRQRIMESHDVLAEDEVFSSMDAPKQAATRELISIVPLYLVQGPPGVGKTRLVRDLVTRRFAEEPTARLLLTAQSNAAVDHLLDELAQILKGDSHDGPLVVRCRAKESAEEAGRFDIATQAESIAERLMGSLLAREAPEHIRNELSQLVGTAKGQQARRRDRNRQSTAKSTSPSARGIGMRAFEGVVVRAANVVFATTNSSELERLIEERGQFDWTIVEEAGKATGGELIAPLLLSHRRLMIGDHKQLPPFNSERMIALLENPASVKEAIKIGEEFIGHSLRDATTDEIIEDIEEDNELDLPALCSEAMRILIFFESAIEAEFRRQAQGRGGKPIAKKLTAQHRMHPVIADLVSECFYEGELTTHPTRREFFGAAIRPFVSVDKERLPEQPVTIIRMPYVQRQVGKKTGEAVPRWHNPGEIIAVKEVLRMLGKNPLAERKPTLAVLSPYAQQVARLSRMVAESLGTDLTNLSEFKPGISTNEYCGTVDSFQGSEADVVVISMVRNNDHANVSSALGFLSDLRRMNVLLSRAKWQLILVCSIDFLTTVVDAARKEDREEVKFLRTMLNWVDKQLPDAVGSVDLSTLMRQ